MSTPDYRMRFPSGSIDFAADVGVTGQDHDNYPAPDQQARYDWMRLTLIALLSHQASTSEPVEFREGSVWYDLNSLTFKVYLGATEGWQPLSKVINVAEPGSATVTVYEMYQKVKELETRIQALER